MIIHKKFISTLFSKESLLFISLILLNTLNIILFYNQSIILLLNSIVLIILYLVLSNRNDKLILIISALNFAFWGTLLESFIIYKTNGELKYRTKFYKLNIPLWLFTVYVIFMISALFTYNLFKNLVLLKSGS